MNFRFNTKRLTTFIADLTAYDGTVLRDAILEFAIGRRIEHTSAQKSVIQFGKFLLDADHRRRDTQDTDLDSLTNELNKNNLMKDLGNELNGIDLEDIIEDS